MQNKKNILSSQKLCNSIIEGMKDNKAKNITVLDLKNVSNSICDYFIICSGDSNTQIDGICTSNLRNVRKELKIKPWHIEGKNISQWVLIDYIDVVVHIFSHELRNYYDLEDLWADAEIIQIQD
jgi:ribosome-associated protein